MEDRLKDPDKREAWERRQRIHSHNGLTGCKAMSIQHMQRIINSPTATPFAKNIAESALACIKLIDLSERVEADGTTVPSVGPVTKAKQARKAAREQALSDEMEDPIPF